MVIMGPQMVIMGPQMVLLGPQMVIMGPQMVPVGPHMFQMGPQMVLIGPKMVIMGPSMTVGCAHWSGCLWFESYILPSGLWIENRASRLLRARGFLSLSHCIVVSHTMHSACENWLQVRLLGRNWKWRRRHFREALSSILNGLTLVIPAFRISFNNKATLELIRKYSICLHLPSV